jgi:two-component system, sensor histidine kinase and response regulator
MLARLAGDGDLARQLVVIFISEYPQMLQAVYDGIEQGSADAVRRAAHALKGSTLNFIEDGPAATAYALERMGREGDISEAPALCARLERELAVLVEQLRRFQTGGA